jgi:hypothetical protein
MAQPSASALNTCTHKQITKGVHKERVESGNPNGQPEHAAERPYAAAHGMFQLSNPFVTCPPGKPLSKVRALEI